MEFVPDADSGWWDGIHFRHLSARRDEIELPMNPDPETAHVDKQLGYGSDMLTRYVHIDATLVGGGLRTRPWMRDGAAR